MAKKRFIDIKTVTPGEPMDDESFAGVVKATAQDAIHYIDMEVAPDREAATAYYRGDPLGNEEDGRSQFVMTEVRDTVLAILPDLIKVFLGSDRVAEFMPRSGDHVKIEIADQATDYVNYIITVENNGFQILFSAFKDALVRKTGILKWYVEEFEEIDEAEYSGFTEDQLRALSKSDDCEIISYEEEDEDEEGVKSDDPDDDSTYTGAEPTFSARIRRYRTEKRFRLECVPPEEFLISRDARDEENAVYIGHRREILVADLVAMGYDYEEILENMGSPGQQGFLYGNNEAVVRNPALATPVNSTSDPSMQRVLYVESYIRIDKDGDGIAERRRVCTIGDAFYVLDDEYWDDMVPFAILCPDPEPHMAIGYSIADQTADIQEIKTNIARNTLDSLAQTIHPKLGVVENQVNMADVLNNEVGAVIRMRQPGMVQDLSQPFVGQMALPVLEYFDQIKAARTGVTPASAGLNADVLQSTTASAVTMVSDGANQRKEMIARIFAETGMKRLMRGLLRLIVRHQDKKKLVRLRGKYVEVDPRYWDADMDVIINTGLGTGNAQEKMTLLGMVAAKQEQLIMQTGPLNPLAGIVELRATYAKMLEIGGFRADPYFKAITPEMVLQYQQQEAAKKQGQPDPNLLLAQAEMAKSQASIANEDKKTALAFIQTRVEDDRLRDFKDADIELKRAELAARYHADVNSLLIQEQMAAQREQNSSMMQATTAAQSQQASQGHEAQMTAAQQAHEAQMAAQQHAAQAQQAQQSQQASQGHEKEMAVMQHAMTPPAAPGAE